MSAAERTAPFSHVLCWVDGSDEACRAAERAAHLAWSLGAKLSFVAVGHEPEHDEGFEDYARIEGMSAPMSPSIIGDVSACLDQAMAIAAKVGVTGATRLTRTGHAATAICDAARAEGADLVVIRKHRSSLVERLLGTSVSDAFADGCEFAVLSAG